MVKVQLRVPLKTPHLAANDRRSWRPCVTSAPTGTLRQTLDGHVDLSLVRPEASHGMHISHHPFSTLCHADLPRVPEAVSCALYLSDYSGLYFRHVRPGHRRRRLCRIRVVPVRLVEHMGKVTYITSYKLWRCRACIPPESRGLSCTLCHRRRRLHYPRHNRVVLKHGTQRFDALQTRS